MTEGVVNLDSGDSYTDSIFQRRLQRIRTGAVASSSHVQERGELGIWQWSARLAVVCPMRGAVAPIVVRFPGDCKRNLVLLEQLRIPLLSLAFLLLFESSLDAGNFILDAQLFQAV